VHRVANNLTTHPKIALDLIDIEQDRGVHNRALRERYLERQAAAAAAIDAGDENAVAKCVRELDGIGETFIKYNLGLAYVLVNRYVRRSSPTDVEEYVDACMETLWSCFITWNPERATFGTWSRRALEGALWREVNKWEHPERSYHEGLDLRTAIRSAETLRNTLEREPTLGEVADHCGISEDRIDMLRARALESLDAPLGEGAVRGDLLGNSSEADDWDDWDDTGTARVLLESLTTSDVEGEVWMRALSAATAELDALGLYLVLVRYGLHGWAAENLPEIAAVTGIGREIVRRRTHRASDVVEAAGRRLPAPL
jgi:DNA-directed RNA polymerase specialized sigma24 family protein